MPSPVVHFEIGCRDIARARTFYGNLFGWEYPPVPPEMAAQMAMVGNLGPHAEKSTPGIGGHISAMGHEPHKYVTVYIEVEDIDAKLAEIGRHGGPTVVPRTEVPGMGHFAWFTDPDGNVVGLWTSMK